MAQIGLITAEQFVYDFNALVKNEAQVEIRTTSGEVLLEGIVGEVEMRSISGEIFIESKGDRA